MPPTDTPGAPGPAAAAKPRRHDLKVWFPYFEAIHSGRKTFELRRNDRDFQCGDELFLREWDQTAKCYSKSVVLAKVTHVLTDCPEWGLQPGFAILSFTIISKSKE